MLTKVAKERFSMPALQAVARQSEGFSMAYVQEIVVNALLQSVDDGGEPQEETLMTSLETMSSQRKTAGKHVEVAARESLGFTCAG